MAEKTTKKEEASVSKRQSISHELRKPFSADKVHTRKGKSNTSYKYIKNPEYINRMNDVFGVAWSVREVESMFIGNNYIVKRVEVCVPDPENPGQVWCRDGWGGHPFTGDFGEAMKSAKTKATVNAIMMFGPGLQLKGIDISDSDDEEMSTIPSVPNVTVVNPGLHNPALPIPPAPPQDGGLAAPPVIPMAASRPVAPPVPNSFNNVPPPQHGPLPPSFVNQTALENMQPFPPVPTAPPVPAMPTGNPSALQSSAVAVSERPGQPITATINLGSIGTEADRQPIAEFQINGLKGEAVVRGMSDPMELVKLIMGPAANSITSINQLTVKQAQDILTAVRQMPPGAKQ